MAHPAFWPSKSFFYPIGNTPPISLTQTLPPDVDATILLLGCGDPRNILYTLYSDGADPLSDVRRFDITCNDIEPAIFARNILLFTLIVDDGYPETSSQIWNIFYHFFLDQASNNLLLTQCRKLATLSVDMETWNTSGYSAFLRISNRFTLAELNRLWTLYAATDSFTAGQKKQFKTKFVYGMKHIANEYKNQSITTAARAAGPLYLKAYRLSAEAHRQYWKTGVTFDEQRKIAAVSTVNPTFAYTAKDDGFVPHYGTCPLPAFHLAPAFALVELQESLQPCRTVFDLFRFAKHQFFAWCDAFRHNCERAANRIVIRFLVGDVLATCHTLAKYAEQGSLTAHERLSPWCASWLTLEGDYVASSEHSPPRVFNVIDTSNLADHMGILNILVAAAPLLSHDHAATLLTETLLSRGEDPLKSFTDRLCCDPNTLFVLLNLVPSGYASGFTTQSNIHEVIGHAIVSNETPQYHERMVWKSLFVAHGNQTSRVAFDATALSHVLSDIYLHMFPHEDMTKMLQTFSLAGLRDMSSIHYCRRSFVLLVRYLATRVAADWPRVLNLLLDHIGASTQLLVGLNHYQDLLCHLHMLGVHTEDSWLPGSPFLLANKNIGPFRQWKDIPSVVCLVMSVPRSKLAVLGDCEKAPNPLLLGTIFTGMHSNSFTFIQVSFGTVSLTGEDENAEAVISEDERGIQGKSPAVISFWVPSWMLSLDPVGASVALGLVSTISNTQLIAQLGPELLLYRAPLMDASRVHVVKKAPTTQSDLRLHLSAPAPIFAKLQLADQSDGKPSFVASMDASCHKIESLALRTDITDEHARTALSNRATEVKVTPLHSSGLELSIGSVYRERLFFPPITDKTKARLRVARQSSWVEIVVPVPDGPPAPLQHSPLTYHEMMLCSWNVHYVRLERLPVLRVDDQEGLQWLNPHVSLMLSDRERQKRVSGHAMGAFTQVKDSIHVLINRFAGTQSQRTNMFALNRTSKGGIDTLIFATHLRLDLAAHTIVLDAFVLPLEPKILDPLMPVLASLSVVSVVVSEEELVAWKHLLPALTERCRTWRHKANCAYVRREVIPLSTEHGENPICDCGRGIVTDGFRAHKEWAPFAPYVTRIAISPLFALSYLDPVGQAMREMVNGSELRTSMARRVPETEGMRCTKCGKKPPQVKLSVCGVCKKTNYCSRDCQVADWKDHKAVCKKA